MDRKNKGVFGVKKIGELLQWVGFILIALAPFQAFENPQSRYILVLMISGATLGLLGSILVKTNKLMVVGLGLGLLTVILYFYFELRGFLLNFFLITMVVLAIVGTFLEKKHHHSQQKI